ncbi:Sushi like protein [Argiope bruennichi]|uniref:Sushi like protein n=1 Tax=Argiope bruennichi TaxID=94029 RepID=A0A8T0EK29_ARGBR|nr:Sushi like protein [Argiope bruennichi]
MFLKYPLSFQAPSIICLAVWVLLIPQYFCATTTCPPPDFPEGGSYTPIQSEYEVGSRISISCKDKFTRFGTDRMTCQTTGRWSGETPFCDSPTKIKNPIASSRVHQRESVVIDGSPNTCFQTLNGTAENLRVFLARPATVYAVMMYLPKGYHNFKILLSEHRNTPLSNAALCHINEEYFAESYWVRYFCNDNNVKAELVTVQVNSGRPSSLSICEIDVYTKDDEWCRDPPENLVLNGQLEINRNKAMLTCNEGFKEKDNRRVYATCEGNKWSYLRLQCMEILCDSAVTNISNSEGQWDINGKTSKISVGTTMSLKCKEGYKPEGKPLTVTCLKNGNWTKTSAICKKGKPQKDYKILAIAVGAVVALIILILLGLTIFLIQRKKSREVVVIYKPGENNSYSAPPSVGGHSNTGLSEAEYSTVYYEAIQNNQFDPRAPPPKPPNLAPKLDRGYSKPVDDRSPYTNTPNQYPTDLAFGTLTKSSSLYNSMN